MLPRDRALTLCVEAGIHSFSGAEPAVDQFAFDGCPSAAKAIDKSALLGLACDLAFLDRMYSPFSIVAPGSTARSSVPEPVW
jgi:hypothetical protein